MATFQTNKRFLLMQFTEFSVLLKHHVGIKTQQSDRLKNFTNSTNFSQSQCWIIKLTERRQWPGFSLEVMERCADIRWTHTHSNLARKPERGKKETGSELEKLKITITIIRRSFLLSTFFYCNRVTGGETLFIITTFKIGKKKRNSESGVETIITHMHFQIMTMIYIFFKFLLFYTSQIYNRYNYII